MYELLTAAVAYEIKWTKIKEKRKCESQREGEREMNYAKKSKHLESQSHTALDKTEPIRIDGSRKKLSNFYLAWKELWCVNRLVCQKLYAVESKHKISKNFIALH